MSFLPSLISYFFGIPENEIELLRIVGENLLNFVWSLILFPFLGGTIIGPGDYLSFDKALIFFLFLG
jgi:hypothetical protein